MMAKERNNTCSYLHRAQQRGQCTKSGILIQATWVFVHKMLNCTMMTSEIDTEYTEFCRIMKRSRWSGFNNTHQSHYTMTESNRSLPPAYFNLLYTQWVSCHVSTQSTRWRQPAPWCYRSCRGPWSCWAPWRDHTANRLQFALQEEVSFVAQCLLAEYASCAVRYIV